MLLIVCNLCLISRCVVVGVTGAVVSWAVIVLLMPVNICSRPLMMWVWVLTVCCTSVGSLVLGAVSGLSFLTSYSVLTWLGRVVVKRSVSVVFTERLSRTVCV